MPIDDFYKKLKEPAPDSFPPFEEEAWKKMEQLLDKHLPEKRGRVFPFVFFLACISLIFLTTFLPAKQQLQKNSGINNNAKLVLQAKPVAVIKQTAANLKPVIAEQLSNMVIEKNEAVALPKNTGNGTAERKRHSLHIQQPEPTILQLSPAAIKTAEAESSGPLKITYANKPLPFNTKPVLEQTAAPRVNGAMPVINAAQIPVVRIRKNSLALTVGLGLETPGFELRRWGRVTPAVGIGLQYSIGKKLLIGTGIAQAKKIYTAQDKDYNAPGYWFNYTNFKKIDADCRIIEIPLSVAYRVAAGKRTNLFLSAGSSSFIMRTETYDYYYKNQYGNDTVVTRNYNRNSTHLFSSVNFSAVAEQKITKRFSVLAEPVLKVPTAGIGFGKVRLYNAGINIVAKLKLL